MKLKVNLSSLMKEAADNCRTPAITYGFQIANGCLARLAKRAVELKDEALLDELETLGYVLRSKKEPVVG